MRAVSYKHVFSALLLVSLLLSIISFIPVSSEETIAVEKYPAPWGYTYILPKKMSVYGYRVGGAFYRYGTDTRYLITYSPAIDHIVTHSETYAVKIVEKKEESAVIKTGNESIILFPESTELYESGRILIYSPEELEDVEKKFPGYTDSVALVSQTYYYPGFQFPQYVFVPSSQEIIISNKTASVEDTLASFVSIDDSCIVEFSGSELKKIGIDGVWGGIIDSSFCTQRIEPVATVNIGEISYIIAFRMKGNSKVTFVLGEITGDLLSKVGVLMRKEQDYYAAVHVMVGDADSHYYYGSPPHMIDEYKAIDLSRINPDTGEAVCILPQDYKVVRTMLWKPRNITTKINLLPGEVVLVESRGKYYVCHGSLEYTKHEASVGTIKPRFREFPSDVEILSYDYPILVVVSNGEIYYSKGGENNRIRIPYDYYEKFGIFIIYDTTTKIVEYTTETIFLSPQFAILVIVIMYLASVAYQRKMKTEPKIQVVYDLLTPDIPEFSAPQEVRSKIIRFMDLHGYCPDSKELALTGSIVPINPNKLTVVDETVYHLLCPDKKYDPESEVMLRKLVELLRMGLWNFKRLSDKAGRYANYGYAYGIVGGTMLLYYVYIYRGEHPALAIINALKAAKEIKKKLVTPYHVIPLGLIIVCPKKIGGIASMEVEKVATPIGGLSAYIEQYTDTKNPALRREIEKLLRNESYLAVLNDILKSMRNIIIYCGNDTTIVENIVSVEVPLFEEYYRKIIRPSYEQE